jgi:hypothetical protein
MHSVCFYKKMHEFMQNKLKNKNFKPARGLLNLLLTLLLSLKHFRLPLLVQMKNAPISSNDHNANKNMQ